MNPHQADLTLNKLPDDQTANPPANKRWLRLRLRFRKRLLRLRLALMFGLNELLKYVFCMLKVGETACWWCHCQLSSNRIRRCPVGWVVLGQSRWS